MCIRDSHNILPKGMNILIETVDAFTNSIRHFDGSRQWSHHTLPQVSEQDMPSVSYMRNFVHNPRDVCLNKAVKPLVHK